MSSTQPGQTKPLTIDLQGLGGAFEEDLTPDSVRRSPRDARGYISPSQYGLVKGSHRSSLCDDVRPSISNQNTSPIIPTTSIMMTAPTPGNLNGSSQTNESNDPGHSRNASLSPIRPVSTLAPIAQTYTYPPSNMLPSGQFPEAWNADCDRYICRLDVQDEPIANIVIMVKKKFPTLGMATLTAGMIDKRLRMLDQDVNVDYWKNGLDQFGNSATPGKKSKVKSKGKEKRNTADEDFLRAIESTGLDTREGSDLSMQGGKRVGDASFINPQPAQSRRKIASGLDSSTEDFYSSELQ